MIYLKKKKIRDRLKQDKIKPGRTPVKLKQ